MKYFTTFIESYKGSYNPEIIKTELVVLKCGFELKIQYAYGDVQVIPLITEPHLRLQGI